MIAARTLLFDLDGTLTDPGEGITNSVAHALRSYGITPPPREALYCFIGPPLHESFQRFFGFSEAQSFEAVERYRDYYRDRGIWENRLYPGIEPLLGQLTAAGYQLALATSKPLVFARQILDHFGLTPHFTWLCGAELDGARTAKAEVVAEALRQSGAAAHTALMIGDREHDVAGARACGLACIGVLYGYGSREELTAAGAWRLAQSVPALGQLLLA